MNVLRINRAEWWKMVLEKAVTYMNCLYILYPSPWGTLPPSPCTPPACQISLGTADTAVQWLP